METDQIAVRPSAAGEPDPSANRNENGQNREQGEDAFVGVKDAWFQEGYRAGYAEGFVQGLKQSSGNSGMAALPARSGPRAKAEQRQQRLKGFPCAVCGCASYSDEAQCPCCGTPKGSRDGHAEERPAQVFAQD